MKKAQYILFTGLSFFTGFLMARHMAYKKIVYGDNAISKYICLFKFANEWISLKQKGIDIAGYFKDREYNAVAIYGMGDLGERLADEFKDADIAVKCAIDRSRKGKYGDIEIKGLDETMPEVDAVIVTPVYDFWEIQPNLTDKFECPIISLEDVICDESRN